MRIPAFTKSRILLTLLTLAALTSPGYSQAKRPSQDRAARLVLDSARRSYQSGQFDSAVGRFAEFISKYPKHSEFPAALYGLGLSQMRAKTLKSATDSVNTFRKASARMDFKDRPLAVYYLGVALRELAEITLATPITSGSDYRATYAKNHRTEAAGQFAAAVDAFIARSRKAAPTTSPAVHPDIIWAARSRADQCDMLLRIGQYKQAIILAKTALKETATAKQFGPRAIYCMGYAYFSLKDYLNAGRTLSKLAPFDQEFGPHARYMLARSHHLAGDMPEASQLYKAILADFASRKTAAAAAARNSYRSLPPDQRAAASALLKGPPDAYIVRTIFYSALGMARAGQFGSATTRFGDFLKMYPKHALAPEARMRLGYCHMQLKGYDEAIKILDPMRKHPRYAERASWWIARSRVSAANPEEPEKYAKTLTTAIAELKAAAQSAHNSGRSNPRAYDLERDIMIELGDVQQLAGDYKGACETYGRVVQYKSDRTEEATQRLATAHHLAGDYSRSESTCVSFQKSYPKSTLLPAIWFRSAENALMSAIHANRSGYRRAQNDIDLMFKNAVNRYQRLLDKFPDFSEAYLARYGLATAQYRLKWYNEAMETLAKIPSAEHSGKLAAVPYLIANCHIRTFPAKTDDALTAGKLMTQATEAAKLLESFASGSAKSPKAPDALLKLGYCCQRLGSVVADKQARQNAYAQGKDAYARLIKNYPKDPLLATAMIEQAKCMVLLGDSKTALNELDRFQREPFRSNRVAPLAITQFSSLLRASNRAIDAVRIVKECLTLHEKDPSRRTTPSAWLVPLRYEYGLATMAAGQFEQARSIFASLTKSYPGTPEAVNSLWRAGQCQRRSLTQMMKAYDKGGRADEELRKNISRAVTGLSTVADQLTSQAKTLAKGSPAQRRLIYEAAWCCRTLGEREFDDAHSRIRKDAMSLARARKSSSSPVPNPGAAAPRVTPEHVPVQQSEAQAMKLYGRLITLAPQSALAAQSRFELAEMHALRRKHDQAVELLETIMENSPPEELAQRTRLRLAACLLDRGDPKRATTLVKLAAAKAKGDQIGHARYLTGEAFIQAKEWSKAIETLKVFRDDQSFRGMTSISDKAMLRLGYAYQQTGNWSECRRTYESVASYMPNSPWVHEAAFGAGWARENAKDINNAMSYYSQVVAKTVSTVAARAQIRIGYCCAVQKKYPEAAKAFMTVPMTYNYPEHNAEAWYRAGAAQVLMKQPDLASRSWKQLIKDYPESPWAKQAKAQLAKLPAAAKK